VKRTESEFSRVIQEILVGSPLRTLLSVLAGFMVGAIFMVASNGDFYTSLSYFFARPFETVKIVVDTVVAGYGGLFRGSIFNSSAAEIVGQFRPLTETLRFAAPLIAAGLGVSLAFRAGLFNIGGTGQIVFGMIAAVVISTRFEGSTVLHMVIAVVVAVIAAALWGG
jgi:simple sugar transport system permease protein